MSHEPSPQPRRNPAAEEVADRILHTYNDVFTGADRADPVEAMARRVAHTLRDQPGVQR